MTSTVVVRGVTKSFPAPRRTAVAVLRGVDLEVATGELLAVLGPSGCGKTTLLRIVAGFEHPDTGTVTIGSRVVAGAGRPIAPEHRHVGIVPQDGGLFPHLDVGGNVAFGLRGLDRDARRRRVGEMLELVGLAGFERRPPHELSGGQQQRVALARALAPGPAVVLLDEPFTALDTGLRTAVRADVAAVLAAAGTTAVLVTHDQSEALSMADRVAVMRDGTIVQAAPPAEVYHRPADLGVARFVGDAVVLPGRRCGAMVECALGRLEVAPGGDVSSCGAPGDEVDVMIRPEQLVADATGAAARVDAVHFAGPEARVQLAIGGCAALTSVFARWPTPLAVSVGDTVGVRVAGPVVAFAPEAGPIGQPVRAPSVGSSSSSSSAEIVERSSTSS